MKKNIQTISIFFACLFIVFANTACKKEPTARIAVPFAVSINNVPASTKSVVTRIKKGGVNRDFLQIVATLANDDVVMVELFYEQIGEQASLDVAKDYQGDFGYQHDASTWYEASVNYPGAAGNITITKNDLAGRIVEGTFSGAAVNVNNQDDKKMITGGSFSVSY